MRLIDSLKKSFFPAQCLGCGQWGSYLCSRCLNFLPVCPERICPVCQQPSLTGLTHPGCQKPRSLDGLTSVFAYQGIVKKAIIKLKYSFVKDLAQTILELFLSFIGEDKAFSRLILKEKIILTTIPLYWQRKNWRGFNQAELLGKMIADNLGIDFASNLLIRVKKTKPQTFLSQKQRLKNVRRAFNINQTNQMFKKYSLALIFDDVWTTGATIKEGAKVLKTNGFKKVWALTLARQKR